MVFTLYFNQTDEDGLNRRLDVIEIEEYYCKGYKGNRNISVRTLYEGFGWFVKTLNYEQTKNFFEDLKNIVNLSNELHFVWINQKGYPKDNDIAGFYNSKKIRELVTVIAKKWGLKVDEV